MKKQEIAEILSEARAMDRGEIAPARVWEVTKRPDGTVERKALNPETYRRAQAREWTAKTQAAKIRRKINITQDAFARMLGVSLGTVRKWERGTHRAKRRRSYAAQDRRKIPSHRPRGCHVLNNHRPYTKECPDGKTPKRIIALCSEC